MFIHEEISTDALWTIRRTISAESLSLTSITNTIVSLMPDIISSFVSEKEVSILPAIHTPTKDESKFLKLIESYPYVEISPLRAYRPEGLNSTYLKLLDKLFLATEVAKEVQKNVVQPYSLFLAHLVSDNNATVSTDHQKHIYRQLEGQRDEIYKSLSSLYVVNSFKSETVISEVVEKNSDWPIVFQKLDQCVKSIEFTDRKRLADQINQSVQYLEILYDKLKKQENGKTSNEVANRLADGAYQVARQVEFFSTTYYRVLAVSGAITNTINKLSTILK